MDPRLEQAVYRFHELLRCGDWSSRIICYITKQGAYEQAAPGTDRRRSGVSLTRQNSSHKGAVRARYGAGANARLCCLITEAPEAFLSEQRMINCDGPID